VAGVVGLVGLGAMGRPMSANLVKAGFDVAAYDIDPERAGPPLLRCESVTQVCERSDGLVVSIVRTLPQTEAVVSEVRRRGLLLVVMSTIDPTAMARLAGDLAGRGVDVLDAPVSGGVAGAEAGSLAIMAAGPEPALERARPVLAALGRSLFHVGLRPGEAQAVKLANQVMLAANIVGARDGLRLAQAHGMAPGQVLPVIKESTGASWVSEHWEAVAGWLDDPTGALGIILKDLRSAGAEKLLAELEP